MVPAYDNRSNLAGKPGLHAFIVGVSAYPNLPTGAEPLELHHYGMRQLSCACLAAHKIYRWLVDRQDYLPVPLATVRLLLTPGAQEIKAVPELANLAKDAHASLDNFMVAASEWRQDASSLAENHTFFYFAGHGAQRKRGDHVMLLEGFGNKIGGALMNAVDTSRIMDGMAPAKNQKQIARTQFYFIDACRFTPQTFQNYESLDTSPVWDVEIEREADDRMAPVFFTTVPGSKAYGLEGQETVFSRALIDCLDGGAGEPLDEDGQQWGITINSLNNAMEYHLKKVNKTAGSNQMFRAHGLGPKVILHRLESPPSVEITLTVDPEIAIEYTQIQVMDDKDQPVREIPAPLHPHPFQDNLPAGNYWIKVNIVPPTENFRNFRKTYSIKPPSASPTLRVAA